MAAQTIDSYVGALRDRLREALDGSRLADALRTLREIAAASRTRKLGECTAKVTKHSYLYRWLTKEPEPEVIVIDLRETYTVGPLIRVLDYLVERLTPYWRDSTLKRGLDGLVALSVHAVDTRLGQLIVTLLEPPEPPDQAGTAAERSNSSDE